MATVTANDVITRAARRINVLSGEEVLSAAEANDALTLLNELMIGFETKGIYYVHSANLAATDTVNMPDAQISNLVWMLCEVMSNEYEASMSDKEMEASRNARLELQAAFPPTTTGVVDRSLRRRLPGFYDFQRDQ